ncbi:MAG: urease accessory protein UreF [Halobacteria archaeon]|nr:urease accessory protein UreF [Halobacteria archaeon]
MGDSNDINHSFLASLQLSDSFLPVGTYTTSYGLESFVRNDKIETADELRELLEDYLRFQVGTCEMAAIVNVHDALDSDDIDKVAEIDDRLHRMTLTSEFREGSVKSGNQLLDLMLETSQRGLASPLKEFRRRIADDDETAHGNYVTVLGIVTYHRDIPARKACLVHGYSFVSDLLGNAQRLMQLGHTEVQEVLTELHPVVAEVYEENRDRRVAEMKSFTPKIDLMSMKHERSNVRLFIS